jgi:hypothetical protein
MKIARAFLIAVAGLLVAAGAAQAWIPPHLIVRPLDEVTSVRPVTYEPPVPLRVTQSREGDEGAFGAPDTAVGEQLVTLREDEIRTLDSDAGELAGDDKLAELMRKCIRGMLAHINEETMQDASQATVQQDTLLGALAASIESCFKANVEGPAAQLIANAQNLSDLQKDQQLLQLPGTVTGDADLLALEGRNGITSASRIDSDPTVLTRWANGDSGLAATAADEAVTTDAIAVGTPDDSGGPSKSLLILGGAVVLFVAFFGRRKLFG